MVKAISDVGGTHKELKKGEIEVASAMTINVATDATLLSMPTGSRNQENHKTK